MAEARWVFSAARSADQEQVGTLFDPAVAGADRQDVGLGDHRHGVEVEAIEGLAWQQLGLGEMACEPPAVPLGDLVLGQCGQQARRRPAFLVRPLGKARPVLLDRGQAQIVEHQRKSGGINVLGHAASPMAAPSN